MLGVDDEQLAVGASYVGEQGLATARGVDAAEHVAAQGGRGTSTSVFADWPHERYPVYGKTGTAQRDGRPDQSWYAAYVDHPTKPVVVVVTTETGGFGAESAAPIAGEIMKAYYRLGDSVQLAAGESATR